MSKSKVILPTRKKNLIYYPQPKPLKIEFVSEEDLTETEQRMRHAQRLENIGTLAAGVVHDFNNYLTTIMGNTDLALRKTAPDNPVVNNLEEIKAASNRAATLTRKILTFSRQNADRKLVSINQIVHGIEKILERLLGSKIEMSINYCDHPKFVFADSAQIEQTLMNLCANARDAMPNGGKLAIRTSWISADENICRAYPYIKPGRYARIEVADTGSGMDEATQQRIFEPFFTTKEIGKGTGIGLSMVYTIVKEHQGNITVCSKPGVGSCFSILLPLTDSAGNTTKAH